MSVNPWTNGDQVNQLNLNTKMFKLMTNNSGATVYTGDVVIFDKSGSNYFKTTSTQGDARVYGVVMCDPTGATSIANGAQGYVALTWGLSVMVNVTGNVAIGDALICSGTPRYAMSNGGGAQTGLLGYATTSFTGSTGQVEATIYPHCDRAGGGVTVVSSGQFTTTASVTVSGTNRLLVVCSMAAYSSTPSFSTTTYGAQTFTQLQITNSSTHTALMAGFLLAPTVGTATLTVAATGVYSSFWILFNNVNQSTPCTLGTPADAGSTTTPSTAMNTTPGNYTIGILGFNSNSITVSGRGGTQSNLCDYPNSGSGWYTHLVVDATPATPSATQTDSWTISNSIDCLVHMLTILPI